MSIADTIKDAVGLVSLVSGVTSSAQSVLDYARPSASNRSGGGTDPTTVIAAATIPSTDTGLRFPADISDYCMTITIKKYRRPSIFAKANIQEERHITLPLPAQLVDSFKLAWNSSAENSGPVGYLVEKAIQAAGKAVDGESGEITASGIGASAVGLTAGVGATGLIELAQSGPGGVAAMQALGIAENKFLSVTFDKAHFKTHQFTWSLYPKTEAESTTILNIINMLRDAALPGLAPGGIALTYPKMIQIRFYTGAKEAEFLYKLKPAVIGDITVNYTGDGGVPAFFSKTKAPVGVVLGLSIQEIELWFNDAAATQNLDSTAIVSTGIDAIKTGIASFTPATPPPPAGDNNTGP